MSDAIPPPPATEAQTVDPAAAPLAEAAVEEAKSPPVAKDPTAASRFAIAARREKAAQVKEQALRQERAQLEQMRKEIESARNEVQGYRKDPLAALRASGLNIDPQTQALVGTLLQNQGNTPEAQIAALNQRIEDMARNQAETLKQAEEARRQSEAQSQERARNGFRGELAAFAKTNGEAYEWSANFDPDGEVAIEVAESLYKQSVAAGEPRVPDPKTVMDKVEAYFEDQFGKVASSKKFAAKFGPKFAPATPRPPTTLTNNMTGGGLNGVAAKNEAERIARALAALDGKVSA